MGTIPLNEMPPNLRDVTVMQVIRVKTYEGHGVPESVGRIIEWFFDMNGELLWKNDPHPHTLLDEA